MRMSICMGMLACVASVATAQTPARAPGDDSTAVPLTRLQAIAMALTANPGLEVARQQTAQVRAQKTEGMALPQPTLSASLDDQTRFLGFGTAQAKNVELDFGIPFPGKTILQSKIGSANVRSAEAKFRLQQQQVAAAASQAYDQVLMAERTQSDLTEADSLARDFLQKTEARFNARSVPRLDVIKAQVDVAQSANDLIANERDLANAHSDLNRILGRPLAAPMTLVDTLAVPAPLPALDGLVQQALQRRPELADLNAQLQAAQANSRLTHENSILPDFSLSAYRDYKGTQGTLYAAGLAFPIPVLFWQHTSGDFAETRHRELELAASIRDTKSAIGQDVRTSYAAADAAIRQAAYIRDQLLPSAREAYRIAAASYALGGLSALDVLDARRSLLDAEQQYTQALAAANSASADLSRAAATPLSTIVPGASRE